MSVLVEKISNSSSGSVTGLPPGDIYNVRFRPGSTSINISWNDPEDTTLIDNSIVQWKGTLLVRNDNHYPESIKDGIQIVNNIERNKYSNYTGFKDTNLLEGHDYYYRFFTYSSNDSYNNNSMIYKVKTITTDPILANNSWDTISKASEAGIAKDIWNIGDEITMQLSGDFNETITLQILDFDHFDKTDGSGKAGLVLGSKYLIGAQRMSQSGNLYGWDQCEVRSIDMPKIYNSLPSDLKPYIKEVNTMSSMGNTSSIIQTSVDKIFIPSSGEVGLDFIQDEGPTFPIFTNDNSRIKKEVKESGTISAWWTRSPSRGQTDRYHGIETNGKLALPYVWQYLSYSFCFCI